MDPNHCLYAFEGGFYYGGVYALDVGTYGADWDRLGSPLALLFLIGFMISEGYYVFDARVDYFGQPEAATRIHVSDVLGTKH